MLPPLDPVSYGPLTRTDLVRYAGASGDFNPLHHNPDFARAAGFDDVFAHGMLSAGLLASALTRWFGAGSVRCYAVRFRSPVLLGDILVARCRGSEMVPGDHRPPLADLTLDLTRGTGEVVLSGTARVVIGPEAVAGTR